MTDNQKKEPSPTTKAVRRLLNECPECGQHLPPYSEFGYGCTHCTAKRIAQIVWDEAVKKSGGFKKP